MSSRKRKLQEAANIPDTHESMARGSDGSIPPPPPGSDQSPNGHQPAGDQPTSEPRLLRSVKSKLICKLNGEEMYERATQLALTFKEMALERVRQAHLKEEMKATMTQIEKRQRDLARAVEMHEEERDVDVDFFMLADNETVSEVRRDTGEAINTRPATDFERQGPLFKSEDLFREEKDSDTDLQGDGAEPGD